MNRCNDAGRRFREAEAELCKDDCSTCSAARHRVLRRELGDALLRILPILPEAQLQLDQLLETDVPLGVLTDIISYMIDLDVSSKQLLLGEVDVRRRAELLLQHLSEAAADLAARVTSACFPPEFSTN